MEQLVQFLSGLPLFKDFLSEEIKELIERSHIKEFSPQEIIIPIGQPGRFLGIIIEGEAEAVITDKSGERKRIGMLNQGDFLGEISLLTGEPTNADVIALSQCRLLMIPHDVFVVFLTVNPHAVRIMAKAISERLRARQENAEEQLRVEEAWQKAPDPYGLTLSSPVPMKILVINCGSSSLKYSFFNTAEELNNREGIVEKIGSADSRLISKSPGGLESKQLGSLDHKQAFKAVVEMLTDEKAGVISDLGELSAVGHRVVHGGEKHNHPVLINDEIIQDIESYSSLAPLHNPINLEAIRESLRLMPQIPQVAVFDTGFHQKMPSHAYLYGLPYEYYEDDNIRRYGFHGISHNYVALKASSYMKRKFREMKIITCHLGNGASVCAIDHGRSIDTSMGLTPLEGLIMGTRCGDLDASTVLHLSKRRGFSVEEIDEILNKQSGLKGLSGISNDLREIEELANKGHQRALIAIEAFGYRIRKYIGAYIAALGGLDALVFTGGIGEGSAWTRGLACQGLANIGIHLDSIKNKMVTSDPGDVSDISDEESGIRVLVIKTDEERMIAREAIRVLEKENVSQTISQHKEQKIPIEVSAHHVHLSRQEIDTLFGSGSQLTPKAELSQPGQYACEETVSLVGPKGRVERVRVLGPERPETQVEISMTEEYKLGIKAPIRASSNLKGTPGIALEGSEGKCIIPHGVICALRHIHISPEYALSFGLKDKDVVSIQVEGERKLIFGDVLVRIHPDFHLSMHIDTDEANAAGIQTGMEGTLVGVQERRS
jgi:acetate kinase